MLKRMAAISFIALAAIGGMLLHAPFAVTSAAATVNKDAVAVIIGNRDYAGGVPDVDFAHNDAAAMKRFVIDVLGFRKGNILDLRDATQAQMTTAFGNVRSHEAKLWSWVKAGETDVVVFYSGHGVPGPQDRRGYLLPVDADPDTPEFNGYPVDLLYANLAKLKARSVTVYLDACFSGDSPKGRLTRAASSIGLSHVPEKVAAGITVVTAARGDQLASWDEETRHGLFTRFLLEGLYGAADGAGYGNGDGAVTLAEVRAYLDDEMTYAARRTYLREQQATVRGDGGYILVSLPEGGAGEPPRIVAATPVILPLELEMTALKNANVRSGPNASLGKLQTLRRGEDVSVTGRTEDGDWYRIALAGGRVGYVFKNLLQEKRTGPSAGAAFRDCPDCPEMVVVPAGEFMMGSPDSEEERESHEGPVFRVALGQPFAIGKYEVTFAEWDACVGDGGCNGYRSDDSGWGRGQRPVSHISHDDATAYTEWLSRETGQAYRLPSEAEWEYAARAGTVTPFHSGAAITTDQANYDGNYPYGGAAIGLYRAKTVPVGGFPPNAFGLHDVHGNLWEWVEDCWNESYAGAPSSANVWRAGDCSARIVRGGSWYSGSANIRSAYRLRNDSQARIQTVGFRIARSLP
ncbi:MAG: SUMF1/EgtB/PvdO family nonheme iron enzyme [Alphaproteobacteria bacterium]|jgi:formylglycine-generating enzyme required for sulfatase activity|nr:SUMF1/EgtB/PvdO family nonheme iron enzyme [Alphaproteobacteria bacterium]MDP6590655.1 SUMF1/EgtB/PvdO family nonheme iron enzyme [Alphaproteobacteria bacterium]MDP6818948.1 SUMF1/EgtB/PvdO family nonheme iron enzyme [Alphaproteobacteria bacterium]